MAKKRNAEIDLSRLSLAIQRARLQLRRFRSERREAVRQYVGSHWSEEGTAEKVPVNLISLYISIIGRNLIAKNPRVMLSTFQKPHKPTVAAMQQWANKEIENMHLQETLQRVVLDALFSVGIAKVALATPAESAHMAWTLPAGAPFIERVDLDDFVYDMHARDFSEVTFMGHRYRVPLDAVRDSKLYTKQRKDLAPSSDNLFNLEGDERINVLGRGIYASDDQEFEDMVDLWEIYLPRHRLVLTLADDYLTGPAAGYTNEALRTQAWLGPDGGPYHILGYMGVPGNAMPKGPIQDLLDLHELTNNLYRKLMRQAERQKEILAVQGGAMEDGSRIQDANDGEIVRMDNPERSIPRSFGAPNQQNFAMFMQAQELFKALAGNLDMLGGLSPQSKTLGQDKLLAQSASGGVSDMQDRTVNFTASVLKALCWYWHHDPFKVMQTTHTLPGLPGMQMQRQVSPHQRQKVSFQDLEVQVDPYSMQHSTPQTRLAGLNEIVQRIIAPMMQLLQQQGVAFDVNAYLKKVADYMNMPDLPEIVTMQEPPTPDTQTQGGEQPGMPSQTERTYNRTDTGTGRTEKGNNMDLMNRMMGHDMGGNPNKNGTPQPAGG